MLLLSGNGNIFIKQTTQAASFWVSSVKEKWGNRRLKWDLEDGQCSLAVGNWEFVQARFQQKPLNYSLLPSGKNRLEILFAPPTGVPYRKSDSLVVVLVDIFITALRPCQSYYNLSKRELRTEEESGKGKDKKRRTLISLEWLIDS